MKGGRKGKGRENVFWIFSVIFYLLSLSLLFSLVITIRTMALVKLRALLLRKSSIVLKNVPKILSTFIDSLGDDEEFVCVAAIAGNLFIY